MDEIYKDIFEFDDYEISNFGNVRNKKNPYVFLNTFISYRNTMVGLKRGNHIYLHGVYKLLY